MKNVVISADGDRKVYGVFTKKGNRHDQLIKLVETEDEAIKYIKEKNNKDRILFYRELEGEDIHYWMFEYDKR